MLKPSSEEIQQSLDVLDRVLSEFDDVETDTHDESTPQEEGGASGDSEEDGEEENRNTTMANKARSRPPGIPPPPPPIDRSLKPKKGGGGGGVGGEGEGAGGGGGGADPAEEEAKVGDLPPALPTKRRSRPRSQEGSTGSSPSETSHEYQEINSDLGALHRPSPPLQGLGVTRDVRRQMSEDRARQRRLEEADGRDRPRRQRSEDGMLSYNSVDVRTLDVPKTRHRGELRPITREARLEQWEEARHRGDPHEARHMRKSRSSDLANIDRRASSRGDDERREYQGRHGQRRSRSSDRWLDSQEEYFDPHMDLRAVDPRLVDPRLMDPRLMDPRYTPEEIMGFPMQDPRFPHLLSFPSPQHPGPAISPGVIPTGALSPIPPGPPFQSPDFPGYPMYPYEMGYPPDLMIPPEHIIGQPGMEHPPALIPPHHFYPPHPDFVPMGEIPPDYPLPLPTQHQHHPGYPPGDYAVDFPYPGMIGGMWAGDGREREEWPPPTPEEAKRLIHNVVRTQSRNGYEPERCIPDPCPIGPAGDPSRVSKRHLKEQQHQKQQQKQQLKQKQQTLEPRSNRRTSFNVGEAVHDHQRKNSAPLPQYSGKDSDLEEVPSLDDGRGNRVGGAFIVTGVFNDTSNMYIPAPPSPTPDYDDDEENDSDGDTSDILQGSQFYVVSNDSETGKKTTSRDSLSDDSLQGTPALNQKKKINSSPESATPLQNMMRKFHEGLPPPAGRTGDEEHFSDDSLEGSHHHPSRSSSTTQKPKRMNSLESLVSVESSTVSFDYLSAGQARKLSEGKTRQGQLIPSKSNSSAQRNNNKKDRKDMNWKGKKSSVTAEDEIKSAVKSPVDSSKASNRREGTQNTHSSGAFKKGEKFNTIRQMLKDGLIEGLDESPPDFKPPPPSAKNSTKITPVEERADSGIGSTISASKTDESGNSDNHSDHSSSPPPAADPGKDQPKQNQNPPSSKPVSISSLRPAKDPDTLPSKVSTPSEGTERNRFEEDEVEMTTDDSDFTPPPPPIRVQSKESKPSMPRNSNWLHNANNSNLNDNRTHRPAPPPPPHSSAMLKQMEVKDANVTPKPSRHPMGKITHVDDIYGQSEALGTVSSAINGNLTARYPEEESTGDHDNPLTDTEFLENLKNLEARPRPDSLTVISEPGDDRGSLGSRGSRSGRFLSRLTDTMKNTSKSSSPSSTSSSRTTTTKLTSTSRGSTRIHGDIIRDPLQGSFREGSLISHQDYQRLPPPSPGSVPLNRDGSGRYRSSEDLADAAAASSSPSLETGSSKKKKHSTLPPSLTPADMRKESKELRRATSLMCGKKTKDETEGSKFRFNVFRGLWRRKQYSFDNKV